ncbi:uncharacterized protein AB675_10494 [Cyphellophora attinorum]|uniref:Tubby C-terminal-like domain-containing protein n=1 Tax=Cyphellophora attinorum TaxID=1664694 RepID=A0A0N0NIX3_9EURO|nr:uncharacterized protein AB675_10494 [Phialophora attinorum]KPI35949.1 hypothetical protein AB675_10494 [Phialophora attinorum]
MTTDSTTQLDDAPPPSYDATIHHNIDEPQQRQQVFYLTFLPKTPLPTHPTTFHLTGDSRSPDLILTHPSHPSNPLATISTDSSLVYHHSHITDHRPGGVMHILRRHNPPGANSNEFCYTITTHGNQGTKLLEITTTPTLLSASSTRLIFRRSDNGELDALRLKIFLTGGGANLQQLDMRVEYQGSPVGTITLISKPEKPVYQLDITQPGIEPVLFAILATVVDDRLMTTKRRSRQHWSAGVPGIGKGPGAGLAGAFALS